MTQDMSSLQYLLLYLSALTLGINLVPCLGSSELDLPPIFLTVSSLYEETQDSNFIDRLVQINWNDNVKSVALFDQDPTGGAPPVVRLNSTKQLDGVFETRLSLGNPEFPGGWARESEEDPVPGEHCLPFWVISFAKDAIKHINCLKIRPTWMYDNRLSLGGLSLSSLMIPGTHNSGCYKRGRSLSQKDVSSRYTLTQEQDVYSQLVYGIRYLDVRVGYYPFRKDGEELPCNDNCFWVNHDLIKVRPLIGVLREVKAFLHKARGEIVLLDLHRFPVGFNHRPARHDDLVDLLQRELGEFTLPYMENASSLSLDTIWQQSGRLIISYADNNTIAEHNWLWPSIRQVWGNKQTVEGLYNFFNEKLGREESDREGEEWPPQGLWAAMTELTPAPLDLVFRPRGSLRTMAHNVNTNLTDWVAAQWWPKVNIIATDFFLGNDLISVAVAANNYKGYSQKHYSILNT